LPLCHHWTPAQQARRYCRKSCVCRRSVISSRLSLAVSLSLSMIARFALRHHEQSLCQKTFVYLLSRPSTLNARPAAHGRKRPSTNRRFTTETV
jgi:hypothetical protein